jgi:hypothetical protein
MFRCQCTILRKHRLPNIKPNICNAMHPGGHLPVKAAILLRSALRPAARQDGVMTWYSRKRGAIPTPQHAFVPWCTIRHYSNFTATAGLISCRLYATVRVGGGGGSCRGRSDVATWFSSSSSRSALNGVLTYLSNTSGTPVTPAARTEIVKTLFLFQTHTGCASVYCAQPPQQQERPRLNVT